jgi:methionyl-tRNA formyltransferase
MRVLFAASAGIAVPVLRALVRYRDFELAGLLTNPDTPRGRHGTPLATETAAALAELDPAVPVLKPEKLDAAAREQIAALEPDLLVSFAYGRLFGPRFLALFPLGGINIHPSLLPKYRGPSPIPAAILNRDSETGITIQRLAAEMDSGDILAQERFPLSGRETGAGLGAFCGEKSAEMLPGVLAAIAGGTCRPRPQDHSRASYCSLIAGEAGMIDWNKSALEIDAQIRAYTPWPLCWTTHGERRLFVLEAQVLESGGEGAAPGTVLGIDKGRGILVQTGEGALGMTALQYPGKKALDWRAFANGARNFAGALLGANARRQGKGELCD